MLKSKGNFNATMLSNLVGRLSLVFLILTSAQYVSFSQEHQDSVQDIIAGKLAKRSLLENQLSKAREQKDIPLEMESLMDLVRFISNYFGDFSTCYIYARELEKLVQLYPDSEFAQRNAPELYHNIGWYLSQQGKLKESIEYFNNSIASDPLSHIGLYYDNMNQLAEVNEKLGEKDTGREIRMALVKELLKRSPNDPDSTFIKLRYYKVIRDITFNDNDFLGGLEYAKKSIDSIEGYGVTSYGYCRLAEFYVGLNQPDSAKIAAKIGLDIAQSQMFKIEEAMAHKVLYDIYERERNFEQALFHFKQLSEIESSIQSFNTALKIGAFDVNSERAKANLDKAIAIEKLSNQRLIILIVTSFSLLLLLGLFYLLNSSRLIKKKNRIIEIEKQRAEKSERFKEQFLANMSHEIRTPMHAISGILNALRRRDFPEEHATYLKAIKISVDNLLVLLNEILDLAKIEAGSLQLTSVPMDVREIVSEVVKLMNFRAEERGLDLKWSVSEDFPKKNLGDPIRLNQILINLIGNAIKFTKEGNIAISLRKNNNHYIIEIKDTGIGIPKNDIDSVFELFKQGREGLNEGFSGTGLGLSITKQLVELQGGRIWVESELGKGCTFFVQLPLMEVHDSTYLAPNEEEALLLDIGKSLSGLHILIAEDNEFNVMVLEDDLKYYIPKVRLTIVQDGLLAVEKTKDNAYDLILMDVQMPELDGYGAARKIRQLENLQNMKRTPIIALTAGILKNQNELCLEAGMDGCILKPYRPIELIRCIADLIGQ